MCSFTYYGTSLQGYQKACLCQLSKIKKYVSYGRGNDKIITGARRTGQIIIPHKLWYFKKIHSTSLFLFTA